MRLCQAEVRPAEARAWWRWLEHKLPSLAGGVNEPIAALLDNAREVAGTGMADAKAIGALLPRAPDARFRAQIIESHAALACGEERWAERLLTEISERAPHVTIAHQRLGQIAFKAGQGLKAAAHFEAAMLSPNTAE